MDSFQHQVREDLPTEERCRGHTSCPGPVRIVPSSWPSSFYDRRWNTEALVYGSSGLFHLRGISLGTKCKP